MPALRFQASFSMTRQTIAGSGPRMVISFKAASWFLVGQWSAPRSSGTPGKWFGTGSPFAPACAPRLDRDRCTRPADAARRRAVRPARRQRLQNAWRIWAVCHLWSESGKTGAACPWAAPGCRTAPGPCAGRGDERGRAVVPTLVSGLTKADRPHCVGGTDRAWLRFLADSPLYDEKSNWKSSRILRARGKRDWGYTFVIRGFGRSVARDGATRVRHERCDGPDSCGTQSLTGDKRGPILGQSGSGHCHTAKAVEHGGTVREVCSRI